jgi:hypothetical protein
MDAGWQMRVNDAQELPETEGSFYCPYPRVGYQRVGGPVGESAS